MKKRMLTRNRFIALIALILVILILAIVGITSESVLHSREKILSVGVVTPETEVQTPQITEQQTAETEGAG